MVRLKPRPDSTEPQQSKPKDGVKRNYTTDLPMVDLETIIQFVSKIREKGLETATTKDVAKEFGYAAHTSTPFYRKQVAARLFGLLGKSGVELTTRATNYLKPDTEDAKPRALADAVSGIAPYNAAIQKFLAKKLNVGLVANGFEKEFGIDANCASICAHAFERSIKFAGFLSHDGVVQNPSAVPVDREEMVDEGEDESPPVDKQKDAQSSPDKNKSKNTQSHTIYLDTGKIRQLTVTAPLDITSAELTRVKSWMEFALIVAASPAGGGDAG